jgi:hypothetical protein
MEFAPFAFVRKFVVSEVEVVLPLPDGAVYVPDALRKVVAEPLSDNVTPLTVDPVSAIPAKLVVVELDAIDVDPRIMGKPVPPPAGVVYAPAPFRKVVADPVSVSETPLTEVPVSVRPVNAVVVELDAIEVDPRMIGNPELPPPITLHTPPLEVSVDPSGRARPTALLLEIGIALYDPVPFKY